MSAGTGNRNKLRSIGILMIISQLMLAGFVVMWLTAQHAEEQRNFRDDVEDIFRKASDRIMDSVFTIRIKATITDSSLKNPGVQSFKIVKRTGMLTGKEPAEPPDLTNIQHQIIRHKTDSISSLVVSSMRRIIVNITHKAGDPFFVKIDSNTVRREFEQDLKKRKIGIRLSWVSGKDTTNRMIVPQDAPQNFGRLIITGYRGILLKKIAPQIAFSSLLFMVCGLAFSLAYATVRKQLKLSAQKDSFISNMSHELKTPVATARIAIEALSKYGALQDPVKTHDYLQMAGWEIDRLETLIGSVLNSMQFEDGRIAMHFEEVDIVALLQGIINGVRPLFTEKNKELILESKHTVYIVSGDRIHLQGALYNIIDNAFKYGGNKVDVKLTGIDGKLRIIIGDNGKGIPEEYRRKVFEKFFRIPSGNVHDIKGYGLGLNYARFVIHAHHGSIEQENNAHGGADFRIVLPLKY